MQTANQEQMHDDDEIDLRDLVRTLIKRKKTIFLVAFITLMGALAYALLATPVYKATSTFLPPSESDISHLVTPNIYEPDKAELYKQFEIKLESRKTYWETFNSLNITEHYSQNNDESTNKSVVFDNFIKNISLERPKLRKDQETATHLFLSVSDESPEMAAKIANNISEQANIFLAREVIEDINKRIIARRTKLEESIKMAQIVIESNKMDEIAQLKEADFLKAKEINDQIAKLRTIAQKNRMDEIEQLKEADALAIQEINEKIAALHAIASAKREDLMQILEEAAEIAKQSGIVDRSGLLDSQQATLDKTAIYTEINTQQQPLYLRGEKALRAEITELKNRKSDEAFIPELRDLQQQLDLLKDNKKIAILSKRENDDPFIPELRGLQEELELLKNNRKIETLLSRKSNDPFIESLREQEAEYEYLSTIQFDASKVKLASFDQPAFPPLNRIKPKRSLIVALGAVLGLFLGIIAAFLLNFWEGMREEERQLAKSTK